MAKPITLEFTPVTEDYLQTMYTFYQRDFRTSFAALGGAIMFLYGLYSLVTGAGMGQSLPSITLVLLWPTFLLFMLVIQPRSLRRVIDGNDKLLGPVTWQAGDKKVDIKGAAVTTELPWGRFERAIETGGLFVFVLSARERTFQFVPKRAFHSADQVESFRAMLRKGGLKLGRAPLTWPATQ